jgi:hypothetical protein
MEPFNGARLKIERAKQHIDELNRRVQALVASGIHKLSLHIDPDTGNDSLQIEVSQVVPEDFAIIIGDALHNLKGALDFTVNEIVVNRLGRYDEHTRFPFRDKRDALIAAVNGGLIKQASEATVNYIVNVAKPYVGGNDTFWALHRLNILDKHRLLLPVLHISVVENICLENERGEQILMGPWVVTRNRIASHKTRERNLKITNYGQPTLAVLFDKGLPLEASPVIPTLHQMTEIVSCTVEDIKTVFFDEGHGRLGI